ncbi:hypothetical protein BD560DRAFT_421924 [Blakeslea trispora]|nr:hypothetical protein BD560DRAFT_421924 [Blakeslea trispora]
MSTEKIFLLTDEVKPKTSFRQFMKTHLPKAILYCTVLYLVFAIMSPVSRHNDNSLQHDFPVNGAACNGKPDIPYNGMSEFTYNPATFSRLSIFQHTNSISFMDGNTQFVYDDQVEQVTVKFDIFLSTQELQDTLWVESEERDDAYMITLKSEKVDINYACARFDLTVRIPSKDAIKALTLKLSNTDIAFDKDLVFETELGASIANGEIRFNEGITAGKISLSIANGEIVGQIRALLDNELHMSIANGHTDVIVRQIDQDKSVRISNSMANGHIRLQLPVSFESRFTLTNAFGKMRVQSPESNRIHYLSRRWGLLSGYFGSNSKSDNVVNLSGSNGAITLLYRDVA